MKDKIDDSVHEEVQLKESVICFIDKIDDSVHEEVQLFMQSVICFIDKIDDSVHEEVQLKADCHLFYRSNR